MPSLDETVYDASDIAESIQQFMRCRWSRRNCPPAKPERASRATAYLLTQICASTWKPRLFRPEPDRSAGQWLARLHADTVRRRNDFGRRCPVTSVATDTAVTYGAVASPKRHVGKRGRVTRDAHSTCRDVSSGGANIHTRTADTDSSSASAHSHPSDSDTAPTNTNSGAATARFGACHPGCQRGRDGLRLEWLAIAANQSDGYGDDHQQRTTSIGRPDDRDMVLQNDHVQLLGHDRRKRQCLMHAQYWPCHARLPSAHQRGDLLERPDLHCQHQLHPEIARRAGPSALPASNLADQFRIHSQRTAPTFHELGTPRSKA